MLLASAATCSRCQPAASIASMTSAAPDTEVLPGCCPPSRRWRCRPCERRRCGLRSLHAARLHRHDWPSLLNGNPFLIIPPGDRGAQRSLSAPCASARWFLRLRARMHRSIRCRSSAASFLMTVSPPICGREPPPRRGGRTARQWSRCYRPGPDRATAAGAACPVTRKERPPSKTGALGAVYGV